MGRDSRVLKQTPNRKHTLSQGAVQTWMPVLIPNKMPTVKMTKTQINQLFFLIK